MEPLAGRLSQLHELCGRLAGGGGRGRQPGPRPLVARRHRRRGAFAPGSERGRSACSRKPPGRCSASAHRAPWPSASSGQRRVLGAMPARTGRPPRSSSASPRGYRRLVSAYARPGWAWFEPVLAYDNARLPEALLRAGLVLGREGPCGRWASRRSAGSPRSRRAADGHFRPVGCESFGRPMRRPSARPAAARGPGHDRGLRRPPLPRPGRPRLARRGRARLRAGSSAPMTAAWRWPTPRAANAMTG